MIGMQEMLLQEADGKILLFPAWQEIGMCISNCMLQGKPL